MANENDQTTPEGATSESRRRRRGRGSSSGSGSGSGSGEGSGRVPPTDPSKLKFFQLIPEDTHIDFVGRTKVGLMISLVLVLLALGTMVFNTVSSGSALNFGIDFQGGSSVRLALTQDVDIEDLRALLDEEGYSGSSVVAVPDAENEVLIRVKEVVAITEAELEVCRDALVGLEGTQLSPKDDGFVHPNESSKIFMKFTAQPSYPDIERLMGASGCHGTASAGTGKPNEFPVEFALVGVGNDIANTINERLGEGVVHLPVVASETVGAKVGSQLKKDGVQAMLYAIGFIFLFVMIRFDLRFAPGGIVALAHDAIIVVGAFALTGKEFNLTSIAAVLTIIGYSINDTIVVFDRVRERIALNRDVPIRETTNSALNETLSRTILTSSTTLIVVLSTWILGSGQIKDFAFALFVGLIAGTYSSLFVASPVFLWINERMYKGKGHLITADKDSERGTGTLLGPQIEGSSAGRDDADVVDTEAVEANPNGDDGDDDGRDDAGGDDGGDDISVKVSDADKLVGERKTRRRRRRPKD
ncbi:Protein-export membrane protein SecF [Enhygromyxa salina]|uniref:Protein-export membrane protein SecF n=1 Tax=Enhygromyxa salina TaxID=215803 RepID=A0A0C2A455_9BACT|nr:protein translocase subunit SecF [Enhygromyxa salina]KIG18173.1 Protein-export membrane protein SecF [Enhygromyxa salina]